MIVISRFLVGISAGMSVRSKASELNSTQQRKEHPCVCVAGVSMNVQPMYFGESAPKHLRGAISLSSAVFTAFGVVLGQVAGLRYEDVDFSNRC